MTPVSRTSYTTSTLGEGLWQIEDLAGRSFLYDAALGGVLLMRPTCEADDLPVDDLETWIATWSVAQRWDLADGVEQVSVGTPFVPEVHTPGGGTEVIRAQRVTALRRVTLPEPTLDVEEPVDLLLDLAKRESVLVVSTSEGEVVVVEPTEAAGTWSVTCFWPGGRRQDAQHSLPEISWRWSNPVLGKVWGFTVERVPVGALRRRTRGTVDSIRLVRL